MVFTKRGVVRPIVIPKYAAVPDFRHVTRTILRASWAITPLVSQDILLLRRPQFRRAASRRSRRGVAGGLQESGGNRGGPDAPAGSRIRSRESLLVTAAPARSGFAGRNARGNPWSSSGAWRGVEVARRRAGANASQEGGGFVEIKPLAAWDRARSRKDRRLKVLGISPLDLDSTASLVEDGRILFASAEERYSRQKQHAAHQRCRRYARPPPANT